MASVRVSLRYLLILFGKLLNLVALKCRELGVMTKSFCEKRVSIPKLQRRLQFDSPAANLANAEIPRLRPSVSK